jgi:hypothetical protein
MLGVMKTVEVSLFVVLLTAVKFILLGVFIYWLMKLHQKPARWLQTLVAIYGAHTLVNLVRLPFMHEIQQLENGQLIITDKLFIVAAMQLWLFIVVARILKDALEIKMGRAIIFTLVLNVFLVVVLIFFSGAVGPESISIEAQ